MEFVVRELPEELFEKAIDLLEKTFFVEETIHVSKKIAECQAKREHSKKFYRLALGAKLSIGCFDEASGELIAVNVMAVESKDDVKIPVRFIEMFRQK